MKKCQSICSPSLIAIVLSAAGCSSTNSGPATIQGLPKGEFNRVFLAAVSVGAAEHCGDPVDGPLVRSNLLGFQTKNGLDSALVSQSANQYDSILAEYKSRIAADTDFCTTEYTPDPDRLRGYENSLFPEVT